MTGVYECEIIEQRSVSPKVMRTTLRCEQIAKSATPGQFVNVQVAKTMDPFLRRPFSIHTVQPHNNLFSLLYVLVGRGTALLNKMKMGDYVNIVGPLGRGFDIGENSDAQHVVIAGGCGAAPLHFLCDSICEKFGCDKTTVLTGASNKDALLCEAEFRAHGVDVGISTDDGSYGYHGFVTELLKQYLSQKNDNSNVRIYSCGPHLMMREVAKISLAAKVQSCQVSLENNMACGLGVCTGCVQKIRGAMPGDDSGIDYHHERVCKDGPVFNAEDIIW